MSNLEERLDDMDGYKWKDTLIFSGSGLPEVKVGENCSQLVIHLLKQKLKLNMNPNEISTSHRIGKKPINQKPDKRRIIAKFCRRDHKVDILNACREIKPDIYANESFTPTREAILFALRKAKKLFPSKVTGCYSRRGRVFA